MSHITEMKTEVKDLDALEDAARALGGELTRNVSEFRYYSGMEPCEHRISFPNARYDIGVSERGDHNGYTLKADWFYTGGLTEYCGQNGEKLSDEYAAAVVWRHYSQQGYNLNRYTNDAGQIVVEASK